MSSASRLAHVIHTKEKESPSVARQRASEGET